MKKSCITCKHCERCTGEDGVVLSYIASEEEMEEYKACRDWLKEVD